MTTASVSQGESESSFCELLDALTGDGDLVALINAYFDESYGSGSNVLCVAGYVFTKNRCKAFDVEWANMLRRAKRLPYFRMSSCAHGNWPFDRLSKDECDAVARKAISLVKRYASLGVAMTVDQVEFREKVPAQHRFGGPYEYLLWHCLRAVRGWMDGIQHDGDVAFFFEAGHEHRGRAEALMQRIFDVENLRTAYRYSSHSFATKEKARPLQAADLLAWQWFKDVKRESEGKPRRKDLVELLKSGLYAAQHINVDAHASLRSEMLAREALETGRFPEGPQRHRPPYKPVRMSPYRN